MEGSEQFSGGNVISSRQYMVKYDLYDSGCHDEYFARIHQLPLRPESRWSDRRLEYLMGRREHKARRFFHDPTVSFVRDTFLRHRNSEQFWRELSNSFQSGQRNGHHREHKGSDQRAMDVRVTPYTTNLIIISYYDLTLHLRWSLGGFTPTFTCFFGFMGGVGVLVLPAFSSSGDVGPRESD